MEAILSKFISEPLFDACAAALQHWQIQFNEITREAVSFDSLYPTRMPIALQDVLKKVRSTYFIGTVDETSLAGHAETKEAGEVTEAASEGKYIGMMLFAVDLAEGTSLTRSESTALTRGFNRIASAQPVVLFIRQGSKLSLATCERRASKQQWNDNEVLGRVSILRNVDCQHPHRGHIDILESIGDKAYSTFEELYKHWMDVFSSELLTKKFYSELSDWYAWPVQVARFPNDLTTSDDDEKFNHESCIRLITRLIFVWFLKQKHLIPGEFFDEDYIRDHFIEGFNPHNRHNLFYNPEDSKYYRAILQNLFFAMLNCPIVAEGKDTPNNRRFRGDGQFGFKRDGYNVNNLMRYKSVFKEGGADEFVRMANSHVPFLNGGLFDCLDDKPNKLYFDGFSELEASLAQLYLPDWLFFGEEVGRSIDLSQWYDDAKKRSVSARGIIDILKRYSFTIEENTPYDQEVSLDPELLGKVFENLLAAYNPETKTSARKQTGSFYTPREIVQYMVNESLVAHLKRMCGDEMEPQYRNLLDYATDEVPLTEEQRRSIMKALYNCRVLDPACGSGAFPMGVLQQMVHVLKRIDPTNEMWEELITDMAVEQSKTAFAAGNEEDRHARLSDIEEAFNTSINDPDYARKLYLIEHCIYGVDIQPIAVQISKLRFFISLVVDQKPTNNPAKNFGIRPLPNLESKFVAANTLIPVQYDPNLVEGNEDVLRYKDQLKELKHKIFLAKRNVDKQRLKGEIKQTRQDLARAVEATGFVSHSAAQQLAGWDMFDQNASSSFFDPEWMFGVKEGFDVVIANPPYKIVARDDEMKPIYDALYKVAHGGKRNLYHLFYERGILCMRKHGVLSYITPDTYFSGNDTVALREFLIKNVDIQNIVHYSEKDRVFENVTQAVAVLVCTKEEHGASFNIIDTDVAHIVYERLNKDNKFVFKPSNPIIDKIQKQKQTFGSVCDGYQGEVNLALKRDYIVESNVPDTLPLVRGIQISKYIYTPGNEFCYKVAAGRNHMFKERVVFQEVANMGLAHRVKGTVLSNVLLGHSTNYIYSKKNEYSNYYVLALLNSKVVNFYFKFFNQTNHVPIGELKKIPFASCSQKEHDTLSTMAKKAISLFGEEKDNIISAIDFIVYHLYNLTYDEVLIIDPETPITREEYDSYKSE